VQRFACEIVEFDRRDTAPFEHGAEILQRRDQIPHRFDGVGLKESAVMAQVRWKARFWSVAVGEAGNFVFSINFETFSSYGAAVDKLNADPAFQTWQAKRLKAGLTSLVCANMATEIEI
jgi:hypothetical protein